LLDRELSGRKTGELFFRAFDAGNHLDALSSIFTKLFTNFSRVAHGLFTELFTRKEIGAVPSVTQSLGIHVGLQGFGCCVASCPPVSQKMNGSGKNFLRERG
jgi:hypothetical protein